MFLAFTVFLIVARSAQGIENRALVWTCVFNLSCDLFAIPPGVTITFALTAFESETRIESSGKQCASGNASYPFQKFHATFKNMNGSNMT
jgi:hypothetical protein